MSPVQPERSPSQEAPEGDAALLVSGVAGSLAVTSLRRARRFVAMPSWVRLWARDSALMLLSQGLTMGATSLAAILIARSLAPSEWGTFSAFLGLSAALAVFVEFGLVTWLLRELSRIFAKHESEGDSEAWMLVSAASLYAVALTAMVVVLGATGAAMLGQEATLVLALALLLLYGGLAALANILDSYLRARRRLRRLVVASVVEKYVLVSGLVWIAVSGGAVWEIGVAYAIAGFLRVFLLGWSVYGRRLPHVPRFAYLRTVLRNSLPFAVTSGALTVVPKLDAFVLLTLSAVAAGYFSLGDRIVGLLILAASVGATTLYPFFARRTHPRSTIWLLSVGFGACGGVVAVGSALAAPSLVPVVFGDQYADAVPAVRLMLFSVPLTFAASPLLVYAFSYAQERAVVWRTIGASLLGTVAIVVGQTLGDVSGAAVGLLVRQSLLFGALTWVVLSVASDKTEARG